MRLPPGQGHGQVARRPDVLPASDRACTSPDAGRLPVSALPSRRHPGTSAPRNAAIRCRTSDRNCRWALWVRARQASSGRTQSAWWADRARRALAKPDASGWARRSVSSRQKSRSRRRIAAIGLEGGRGEVAPVQGLEEPGDDAEVGPAGELDRLALGERREDPRGVAGERPGPPEHRLGVGDLARVAVPARSPLRLVLSPHRLTVLAW